MSFSRGGLIAALFVAVSLALLASAASAATTFGPEGSDAGQTRKPAGLAVDPTNGNVYVADRGNNRVDVFASDGSFLFAFGWGVKAGDTASSGADTCTALTGCRAGFAGEAGGQFDEPRKVAVAETGDVYVFDAGNLRVQKFTPAGAFVFALGGEVDKDTGEDVCTAASGDTCGAGVPGGGPGRLNNGETDAVAVGPGNTLYVADSIYLGPPKANGWTTRIEKFDSDGAFLEAIDEGHSTTPIWQIAVDSTGAIYAQNGTGEAIRKLEPDGTPAYTIGGLLGGANGVAVDATDRVLIPDEEQRPEESGRFRIVAEYDSTGNAGPRFGYEEITRPVQGIATNGASDADVLFVSEQDHIDRIVPPSPGPLVIASTVKAPEVHSTRATLRAAVNPEGKSTMVRFEYVDEATYQEDLPNGFEHAQVSPTGAPIGSDSTLHLGEFEATGLAPETTYRFRAVAEDDEGRLADGEGSFKTLPPFEAKATWATGVSTSGATLHAEVNPLGTAATARFEYVSGGQFQESGFVGASSLPSTPIDLGAGESPVEASVALAGLAPATTYYYRVSVSDHCKPDPGVVCTFEGPTRYLITFGPAPQPDVDCPNQAFRVGPSAQLANCRAYEMVSPVEKNNVDVYPLLNLNSNRAILDQSSSEGSRFTYTTSQGFGDAEGTPYVSQYLASRTGSGWTDTGLATAQGLTSTEPGNRVDLEYRAFTPDLCTGALRNETNALLAPGAIPNTENLYLRRSCGGTTLEALGVGSRPDLSPFPSGYRADIQGLSADGRCVVYKYAGAHEKEQLWEVCAGQPPLPVGILPDGAESSSGAAAGTENSGGEGIRTANVLGAISADGTKLYWTAAGEGDGPLYLRLNADQPQSALSGSRCTEPAKGCTVPVSIEANSHFWAASPDGDTALYTVRDESAFDLDSFDATRRRSTEIASGVTDIVGASADARAVAFVSDEVLTSESNPQGSSPTAGGNNLYLYDPDSSGSSDFHFIATLAAEDVEAVGNFFSPVAPQPYLHTSRVSADGHHVVFMSRARLTGYDNTDSQSRDPVAEIYTYSEGETSGGSSLSCVSCNPSNQLPVGVKVSVEGAPEFLLAAALLPPFQTQLHGATAISSDGDRIFFDSYEALVPTDTDGTTDVYEWEAPGSSSAGGRCTVQRPTYSAVSGGCISLISSGDSEAPAELLDADPDGRDVFFSTSTSLLPQDPGLVDIYDAREGGGFPLQASGGTPCEGQGCQAGQSPPAAAAPQTGVARRGNPRRTCPKGRRKVRHHGKLRCVSRRHRRHGKRHHKKRKAARHHGRRHGGGKGR